MMRRTRRAVEAGAIYVLLGLAVLIAILPVVGLLVTAFNPSGTLVSGFAIPTNWDPMTFVAAWEIGGFAETLTTSVLISVGVVVVTTMLAVLAGFAFATFRFPAKELIFRIFLVGLVIPAEAVIVPVYFQVSEYMPVIADSYIAVIAAESALFLAFGVYWMRSSFTAAGVHLIEAAKLDGAGSLTILRAILLPLTRAPQASLMILLFLWSWNEFLIPLVLLAGSRQHQTAPVGLARFADEFTQNTPALAAGALIVAAPILLLYAVLQRHFVNGVLSGAMKG